jgi:hypothetical protein
MNDGAGEDTPEIYEGAFEQFKPVLGTWASKS